VHSSSREAESEMTWSRDQGPDGPALWQPWPPSAPPPGATADPGSGYGWSAAPQRGGFDPLPPGPPRRPPKRRRNDLAIGLSIAGVALVCVVALVAAAVLTSSGGSRSPASTRSGASHSEASHTISLPSRAAGFRHMSGNVGRRLVAVTRRRAKKR